MTTIASLVNNDTLAALDAVGSTLATASTTSAASNTSSISERILNAYDYTLTLADQITDPGLKEAALQKLQRSNVRGSIVVGVRTAQDVAEMLSTVRDWKLVTANLKDTSIEVWQGTLDEAYLAHAAYATVREIAAVYGPAGLGSIQAKQGTRPGEEIYFCTHIKPPTTAITVQLRMKDGQEEFVQFFAGVENTSRMFSGDGDVLVRCGSVIPQLGSAGDRNRRHPKAHRSGASSRQ
jgi:hypothetical protein